MTTETMEAGRELDALIAERVFGRQTGRWGSFTLMDGGDDAVAVAIPLYSTDIADAWEVVEKMRATHWTQVDGIGRPTQVWRATFNRMSDPVAGERYPDVTQIAPTAPLAICRAALLATDPAASVRG